MIIPYIDMSYDDWLEMKGTIFTCGYIESEKTFQIALTMGYATLAIGVRWRE